MVCGATPTSHCCWVGGEVCEFFDPAGLVDGRDGACTLRTELGSWDAVHKDGRYLAAVKAEIPSFAGTDRNCGDYPFAEGCGTCGVGR